MGLQEWKSSLHSWLWSTWPPVFTPSVSKVKSTKVTDRDKKNSITLLSKKKIVPWQPSSTIDYKKFDIRK
jgi:hypothetical protein